MINKVTALLTQIEEDNTVPRNIRSRIRDILSVLNGEGEESIKLDKSLQELDLLSDDPNVPSFTRTQIWNAMSLLESNK